MKSGRFSGMLAIEVTILGLLACSDPVLSTMDDGEARVDADGTTVSPSLPVLFPPGDFPEGDPTPMVSTEAGVCSQTEVASDLTERPVDIVFVVDNATEIRNLTAQVERQLNQNFAGILDDSGIDYRVVVLSGYGIGFREAPPPFVRPDGTRVTPFGVAGICVTPPLGNGIDDDLDGRCDRLLEAPAGTDRFTHLPLLIRNRRAPCQFLEAFDGTKRLVIETRTVNGKDAVATVERDVAPLRAQLRPGAFKVIVFVTVDGFDCKYDGEPYGGAGADETVVDAEEIADAWMVALRDVAPEHFGSTSGDRRFSIYSIVGQQIEDDNGTSVSGQPVSSTAPLFSKTCGVEAVSPGIGYQALSVATEGYRFSACEDDYGEMFKLMAQEAVRGARIPCTFDLPQPKAGEDLDLDTVEMTYLADGVVQGALRRIASAGRCNDAGFLIQADKISLCPQACRRIGRNPRAVLKTRFGCTLDIR